MQRQAGLEPQRVAGAEPRGRDAGVEQSLPARRRPARRARGARRRLRPCTRCRRPTRARRRTRSAARRSAAPRPRRARRGPGARALRVPAPRARRATSVTSSMSHSPAPWKSAASPSASTSGSVFDALGITRKSPGAVHHTMMSSTTWASSSSSRCVYCALPGAMRSRSLVNAHCNVANAPAPCTCTEPRCDTSNTTACSRHARCSSSTPVYWMGISHPPNGTMRAPRARCCASSGECLTRILAPIPAAPAPLPRRRVGEQVERWRRRCRRRAATAVRGRTSPAAAGSRAGRAP